MEHQPPQTGFEEDIPLAQAARNGDHAAFEALMARYRPMIISTVRGMVSNREVDDLVQEAVTRAWEKIGRLKDPQAFAAWLKSLTVNLCRAHNRQTARRRTSTGIDDEALTGHVPDPLEKVLRWEQSLRLREALAAISPENRRALIMRLWGCYEYAEIADKLGTPVSTVVGRIHRAKNQLRRLLGVAEPDRARRAKGKATMDRMLDKLVLVPQIGHADGVRWIAVSPDGRRFASANDPGTMIVWDLATGQQELRVERLGFPDALCISRDGRRVAVSGYDKSTVVWDVEQGAELAVLPVHGRPLRFSEDGSSLWTAVWTPDPDSEQWVQSSVLLWDIASKKVTQRIENMPGTPRALSADARMLVTVVGVPEYDKNVFIRLGGTQLILWDLPEGQERCRLSGLDGMPVHVATDSGGRWIAASSRDPGSSMDVLVWDAQDGTLLHTLPSNGSLITSLAFSPDGTTLLSTNEAGSMVTWDAMTGGELRRFEKGSCLIGAAFTTDGRQVITSAVKERPILFSSGGIAIWDAFDGSLRRQFDQNVASSIALAFSPDGESMAETGLDDKIQIWDAKRGVRKATIEVSPADFVFSVAFHPSGAHLAASVNQLGGERQGRVIVVDVASGSVAHTPEGEADGFAYQVAFSPNGSRCAASWLSGIITVWDADWQIQRRLKYREGWTSGKNLAFSPDGRLLAASSLEISPNGAVRRGDLTLWDVETGEVVHRWEKESGGFEDFAFSPDGSTIAAGMGFSVPGSDPYAEVRLMDVSSGQEKNRLSAPMIDRVITVLFSSDGEILAAKTVDGAIAFWRLGDGKLLRVVHRDSGVGTMALSPTGGVLASTGSDGLVRLWDFSAVVSGKTDKEAIAFASLFDGNWIAYTPDGYYDCSPGAEDYLLWRKGGQLLPAAQCPDRRKAGLME